MSIVSEINRINTNISNAYVQVNLKGGSLPEVQNSNNLANTIQTIPTSSEPVLQEKNVVPSILEQIIEPDENYDGLSKVIVGAVNNTIDNNIVPENLRKGITILEVEGTIDIEKLEQDIININNAFEEKGVDVGETPSDEYDILLDEVITNTFNDCFSQRTDLSGFFRSNQILTTTPYFDTSNAQTFNYFFAQCTKLNKVPQYDFSNAKSLVSLCYLDRELLAFPKLIAPNATGWTTVFNACNKLVTIEEVDMSGATQALRTFENCTSLENITFSGVIPIGLDFSTCSKLTIESLLSILNALKDLTGATSQTLTLGSTNIAKLTSEQISIATDKNWVVA